MQTPRYKNSLDRKQVITIGITGITIERIKKFLIDNPDFKLNRSQIAEIGIVNFINQPIDQVENEINRQRAINHDQNSI